MYLTSLILATFRSYKKSNFTFSKDTTVVIGPNTAGKSNFLEAIYLLATGKSFKAENDTEMVQFNEEYARIFGSVLAVPETTDTTELEVFIASNGRFYKRYKVNNVPRRRVDFAGNLLALLFLPSDLEIIIGSPSIRRSFLDSVLDLTDREYRVAHTAYLKALRQRNALLDVARDTGIRNDEQFAFWDELLITNGNILTQKRQQLIDFMNASEKTIIDCRIAYEHSTISKERLLQYKQAEVGAAVTLVGPHRDDFSASLFDGKKMLAVKAYGSRGQQRLIVLQLKLLQLSFIEQARGVRPVLLLDDIFSELDDDHIKLVMDIVGRQQTIITTTHKEFIDQRHLKDFGIIELPG